MKERLQASDYRFLAICLTLLVAAVWYSAGNFYRAFPEASIDFRVSRIDAQHQAEQFLAAQGYRLSAYREASSFTFDDDAKTFLERDLGLEKANRLMGTRVRLWRWSFRWFRPQQKEEFRADITPTGEFAGFDHDLAEDTARPEVTTEKARALAEDFLRTRAHRDPASLEFVEASSVTRPHRVDRTFTWKERDFNIHDASNRVAVTLLGDEVGSYSEYLKVPEQWTRDYERLRSKNNEAQTFDGVAMFALVLGLIVVLVQRVRRQDVRWRRAAFIGVLGMALSFLSSLNEFPLAEFGYGTTDSYGSFMAQKLLQAALNALAWGGGLFLLAAGAEVLYREALPGKISLGSLFTGRGLRTKHFFLGATLGVTLCAIFIAYQTIFYIVAYRYGAWSPADVPYSDLLNTRFPWLFVLIGGYLPAVSEEFLFRMFAIPYLRKLVRWLPAAVVLAAFTWGFGHSGYPQQPFFIRGLEVGIGGVALGLIMLRWGILPTLVWHYSVDAMYSAMLLLRSHSLYFKLSGAASAGIFILPIVAALVAYWRHGGFEPETGLRNSDELAPPELSPPVVVETPQIVAGYRPLSGRLRLVALAICIAGLGTALNPAHSDFGESPGFRLTAGQAQASADAFLRAQGIDPGAYKHVTFPEAHWGGNDSLAAKYFLEHAPVTSASKLFQQYRPLQVWATRYFKSLEKEEFFVTVQPETGEVLGYQRQLPEERAGADLATDAARQIAATFASTHGLNVSGMELKESDSEKRKARRDYTMVWEAPAGDARNLDEAHYRVEVAVDGDVISSMRTYWKLPETFERDRGRQNFIVIALLVIKICLTAGAVVFGMLLLIRQIRNGLVPWSRTLRWAILPTAMTVAGLALTLQANLYRSYPTTVPFEAYVITSCAGLAVSLAFAFVMYSAASAVLLAFFPESVVALRLPGRRLLAMDAVVLLLLAIGLWQISHQVSAAIGNRWHTLAIPSVDSPALIGNPAPAIAALADGVRSLFSQAAVLAVLALAVWKLPKRWLLAPLVVLAACASISGDVHTMGEFGVEFLQGMMGMACAVVFCLWFARDNYLAYLLVIALGALHPALAELMHSANPSLETQGGIVAAAMAAVVAWAIVPALVRRAPG